MATAAKEEDKAVGPQTGGKIMKHTVGGNDCLIEQYVGLGPLAVKTVLGEVKARSGDCIIYLYDDELHKETIAVIPQEVADLIKSGFNPAEEEGLSESEYEKLKTKHSTPATSAPKTGGITASAPTATTKTTSAR